MRRVLPEINAHGECARGDAEIREYKCEGRGLPGLRNYYYYFFLAAFFLPAFFFAFFFAAIIVSLKVNLGIV
jgi:hypothetical protein